MTEEQYANLTRRMRHLFPSIYEWWVALEAEAKEARLKIAAGNTNAVDVVAGIRERWRMALLPVDYENAKTAVETLATQPDDPWPFPRDKERAGAIVAALAKSIGARQASVDSDDDWRERRMGAAVGLTQGISRQVEAAIADSPDHDAACQEHRQKTGRCRLGCPVPRQAAAKVLADEQSGLESDQSRYSCRFCQDRGTVPILRPDEVGRVAAIRQVGFSPRYWLAACSCSAGTAHANRGGIMVFDPQRHAAWSGDEKAVVTSCVAIVEDCGGRRVAAFDAFNAASEMQYSA